MTELRIFDLLIKFNLFQGMSRDDLELVASQSKLGFADYKAGQTVIQEGDACEHVHMLVAGKLQAVCGSIDHHYTITEELAENTILELNRLFGWEQHYSHTYKALTDCQLISIDKQEVMALSNKLLVFKLNLLNTLATQSQKTERRLWLKSKNDLEGRIISFIEARCLRPAGPKVINIKMNDLAHELNDSRLLVSRALHRLQDKELISISRGIIKVPALEKLLMLQQ